MQHLPCPSRAQVRDHLVSALTGLGRSRYPVTEDQLSDVIAIYDRYDSVGGLPREALKGETLDEALRDAIEAAYELITQRDRRLRSIRSTLMRGVDVCPICGIAVPYELDHYLPKRVFPTLAIYVRNLVPICGICNRKKSNAVEQEGVDGFVHAYFGTYLEQSILTANISMEHGGLLVEFGIDPKAQVEEEIKGKLAYHLRRFELNERYAREINIYLAGHATGLRMVYDAGGGALVKEYLERQSNVEIACLYINHWRPVLLSSLSKHVKFCQGGFIDVLPHA